MAKKEKIQTFDEWVNSHHEVVIDTEPFTFRDMEAAWKAGQHALLTRINLKAKTDTTDSTAGRKDSEIGKNFLTNRDPGDEDD